MKPNAVKLEIDQILNQFLAYSKTSMGRDELNQLDLISSVLVLRRQLKRQAEALQATIKQSSPTFYGLSDITDASELALKGGILSIEELVAVSRFLHGQNSLVEYYKNRLVEMDEIADLFESLFVEKQLNKEIDRCFSVDFEVYDDASPELKRIRRALAGMNSRIDKAINDFMSKHSDVLSEQYSTIKADRRVLPIQTTHKNRFSGLIHDQSASGQTTYIEPQFLIDLNNEKQNLQIEEHQEIHRICKELSQQVGIIGDQLMASVHSVGLLDALFSMASWAKDLEGTVASLSESDLVLTKARHPLLDQETVVANDYRCVSPHRMILITGPNTGGKTVGLKTIGVSVYLTLCGAPILADEAVVPLIDNLFVDIGDQQSIQMSLSTFSGHLTNLKKVLDLATKDSLILLDELGSGTDPIEGESLAQAILEYCHELGCMGVITTHFNRLKVFAKNHDEILSSSVEFDLDNLQPTYRYIEGLAGQSYALDIARKLEVKSDVIDRAIDIKQQSVSQQEQLIEKLEQEIAQQRLLTDEIKAQKEELEKNQETLNKKLERLDKDKESILKTFENKQEQQLRKSIAQAKQILSHMRDNPVIHENIDALAQIQDLSIKPIEQEEFIDRELKEGDMVRILSSQQIGRITKIEKKEAFVDVNGLSMRAKLNQLRYHEAVKTKKPKRKPKASVSVTSTTPFKVECNLIGMRVDEALIELSSYIDSSVLNNVPFGRVIHGHGTGALRQAVHEALKQHKQVKSYRLGGEKEGGHGATVIEFR